MLTQGVTLRCCSFFFLPQGRGGEGARCQFKQCQIQSFLLLFVFKGSFFPYAYSKVKKNKQTRIFVYIIFFFQIFFKEKKQKPSKLGVTP